MTNNIEWELIKEPMPDLPLIWKPNDDDNNIRGKIINISKNRYGIYCDIETIDDRIIRTPAHISLQGKLELINLGDVIDITWYGKNKTSSGRAMNIYMVLKSKEMVSNGAETEK